MHSCTESYLSDTDNIAPFKNTFWPLYFD